MHLIHPIIHSHRPCKQATTLRAPTETPLSEPSHRDSSRHLPIPSRSLLSRSSGLSGSLVSLSFSSVGCGDLCLCLLRLFVNGGTTTVFRVSLNGLLFLRSVMCSGRLLAYYLREIRECRSVTYSRRVTASGRGLLGPRSPVGSYAFMLKKRKQDMED